MSSNETYTPEQISEAFEKLRAEEAYGSLGSMFFELFVTLPLENPTRARASLLWSQLTDEEQNLCENSAD